MATKKVLRDNLRARYVDYIRNALTDNGEEVLQTNSNQLTIPCVDEEGNDEFVTFTIQVPTGSRDGEPYDGYGEAESYKLKCAERDERAKVAAAKKARDIAKDRAAREAKAKAKAQHEAQKTGA